jgi:hypothetical protein
MMRFHAELILTQRIGGARIMKMEAQHPLRGRRSSCPDFATKTFVIERGKRFVSMRPVPEIHLSPRKKVFVVNA